MSAPVVTLARRRGPRLDPDPARVIAALFVPGQEGFDHQDSRTGVVLTRLLALDDREAHTALDDVFARFEGRHRDLHTMFQRHASEVADRLESGCELSETRRLLLGATFTSEHAIEGAALCNPSIVAHPDQSGVPVGSLRFVMSVRGIGEGHRSSVGFRMGLVDDSGQATVEPVPAFATAGTTGSAQLEASAFRSELRRRGDDAENAGYVLDSLAERFTWPDLEVRLRELRANLTRRRRAERTIDLIRAVAERTYGIEFPGDPPLSERVLWPSMSAESHGMEDARFVRFTHDDGSVVYYATYTAYDGDHIRQQMLETADFRTFTSSPIVGEAAANKGLALFPRRIHGRFAALSRCDRETNSVAFSNNPRDWPTSSRCQMPTRAWEVLQLGNCGSPIETAAGWLVLTHGVGPMRTYSIGAILLDRDDPTVVLGQLPQPLLTPASDEQDGYVPNVVYSCGALVHAGNLVLPYGISDAAIGFASVPMSELLAALERSRER